MSSLMQYVQSANLPDLTDAEMASALSEVEESPGRVQYISFSGKKGRYAMGQNKEEPEGHFIVEPKSFMAGWICWKGNRPVDRHEWSIYEKPSAVQEHELQDHGPYRDNEGWAPSLAIGAFSADTATQVKFSTNSKSGCNAVRDLINEVRTRLLSGEPSLPIIEFDSEEFTAQENTNYKPKLAVAAWASRESVGAFLEGSLPFDDLLSGVDVKKVKRKKK